VENIKQTSIAIKIIKTTEPDFVSEGSRIKILCTTQANDIFSFVAIQKRRSNSKSHQYLNEGGNGHNKNSNAYRKGE
jgi:hypothetical protein